MLERRPSLTGLGDRAASSEEFSAPPRLPTDEGPGQAFALEKLGESNPKLAKTKLAVLRGRLKGTDLEPRVKTLIAKLASVSSTK